MPIVLTGSSGLFESLTIDPSAEDAANVATELEDSADGYRLISHEYPAPERDPMSAGTADTEGDPYIQSRYRNRTITAKVRVSAPTNAALQTAVTVLTQAVAKLAREGGTLRRTLSSDDSITFTVLDAQIDVPADWYYLHRDTVEVTLTFTCLPFGMGADEVDLGAVSITSDPVAVLVASDVPGDLPALGRLVLQDDEGADQWYAQWGVQSRHYSGSATAKLFYEAEACLPQGGGTLLTLSGASGGAVVNQGTLTPSYQSLLSLASAGTVYPTHVGDFNVWARLYRPSSNAGAVTCAFEWAEGDFTQVTRNPELTYDVFEREVDFTIADLGQVHLQKAATGSQRWDGRVIAKSTTTGDDLAVDCVWLQPITEGAGEVTARFGLAAPTVFTARDGFDQTAGSATGKTAAVGGVWAGAGDSDDFTIDTSGHTLQRTATSDTSNIGRLLISGVSAMTDQLVQIDAKLTYSSDAVGAFQGVVARYVDANNWAILTLSPTASGFTSNLEIYKYIAGVLTRIGAFARIGFWATNYVTLRLLVTTDGRALGWATPSGVTPGMPDLVVTDVDLAPGGVLASGKPGIYDADTLATAITRNYDNFVASVPVPDAALFANQTAEVRWDRYQREDSAGTVWANKTIEGSYLKIPPSGNEGRSTRVLVKLSRGDPDTGFDSAIDDATIHLYARPRFLQVPGQ